MLTRPPPAPRTRTSGRAPRGAQVRPFGGLSPCPASSSKQMKAPRSRATLYLRPHLGLPHRDRGIVPFHGLAHRNLARPAVPAHQLPGPLHRVTHVEQLADQRLDPAQRPALVPGEPVRQRAFPQLLLQPGPLLRAQLLPRHRPPGPQRRGPAVPPGPPPPPHRPFGDPQVACDLVNPVPAGKQLSCLQPQPLTPLLLGGRIPAPLRIPHALVVRPQPADVTTRALRVHFV